jgi:hypothetical protein
MTDRELLGLAAKAAGYEYWVTDGIDGLLVRGEDLLRRPWNPLRDNGDALALAVKCEIAINPWAGKTVCWHERSKATTHEKHDCSDDPEAATRRAIVRAAAEIGKRQSKPLTTEEFTKWVGDTWNECQEKAWKEDKT